MTARAHADAKRVDRSDMLWSGRVKRRGLRERAEEREVPEAVAEALDASRFWVDDSAPFAQSESDEDAELAFFVAAWESAKRDVAAMTWEERLIADCNAALRKRVEAP